MKRTVRDACLSRYEATGASAACMSQWHTMHTVLVPACTPARHQRPGQLDCLEGLMCCRRRLRAARCPHHSSPSGSHPHLHHHHPHDPAQASTAASLDRAACTAIDGLCGVGLSAAKSSPFKSCTIAAYGLSQAWRPHGDHALILASITGGSLYRYHHTGQQRTAALDQPGHAVMQQRAVPVRILDPPLVSSVEGWGCRTMLDDAMQLLMLGMHR